jgi:hypothetical protein
MAVREFIDHAGTRWRVWCITPDAIHPVTRAEDYLADCYQLGWLVFETENGDRKKRLCPFPAQWEALDDSQLAELLTQAEIVPPRDLRRRTPIEGQSPQRITGEFQQPTNVHAGADLTDLTVIRTFRYPGGRFWTVAVAPHGEGGRAPVLRFTAGARTLDLQTWPRDWPDFRDDQLIELLRNAAPRPLMKYTPETPRRRYNDPPA